MTITVAVRTAIQATVLPLIINEFTKGHWANSRPFDHGKDWTGTKVVVAKDSKALGLDATEENMPRRTAYDLCNTDFVESIFPKAAKAIKRETGEAIDHRTFRKELFDLMSIIRTPKGEPLHQFRIGQFGEGAIGRPKADAVPPAQAKAAPKAKSKAKAKKTGLRRKAKVAA